MDGGSTPVTGRSQGGKKRSCRHLMVEEDVLDEPDSDSDESIRERFHEVTKGALNKKRQRSGNSESEFELSGVKSPDLPPACPVFVSQDDGVGGEEVREPTGCKEEKGSNSLSQDIEEELLYSCCPAEGSADQAGPCSVLELWVDQDHLVSPLPDTSGPVTPVCSPTASAWDPLTPTPTSPGCWEQDPVDAAARLHLLGEALCLIGHHLQETTKMVRVSSSVSLLLDSLLCALAPLLGLTAEIPELRSCTQHSLASTLENISYVMPGM